MFVICGGAWHVLLSDAVREGLDTWFIYQGGPAKKRVFDGWMDGWMLFFGSLWISEYIRYGMV